MHILVTRPAADAGATAARLGALGHEVTIEPLLEIEARPFELPAGPFTAIVITSANAVRAIAEHPSLVSLRALPLYAVGAKSGEAARDAGFVEVIAAAGDARSLAQTLMARLAAGARVLYLAGFDQAQDIAALVAPGGIAVETRVVYRARIMERLGAAAALLRARRIDAVLHYSARSAGAFVALARREGLDPADRRLRHLCLSDAVAAVLRAAGARVEVAVRPDESALLALIDR